MTSVNHTNSNLRTATMARSSHNTGVRYKAVQNILLSVALTGFCASADSKTQILEPSSPVSENHLRPTKRRPLTFFTVQKSKARRSTIMTNIKIKFVVKNRPKRYVEIAVSRNPKRKNKAIGCDESWKI